LRAAEEAGFPALLTADKNLPYQQSLKGRTISVVVLGSRFTDYVGIAPLAPRVVAALESLTPGTFLVVRPETEG
jgi:hypothetical protein